MRVWIYFLLAVLMEQSGSDLKRPEGWKIRFDRPGFFATEPSFVSIAPGWQFTTGSSAIAYDPAVVARGNYKLESEILLFPGGENGGYGLFFGGSSLDSNELSYTAFQLRRDGKYSIFVRKGPTTRD